MSFGRKHGKIRKIRRSWHSFSWITWSVQFGARKDFVSSIYQGRKEPFLKGGLWGCFSEARIFPFSWKHPVTEAAAWEVVRWETRLLHHCFYTRDSSGLKAHWQLPACCTMFSWGDLLLRSCSVSSMFPHRVHKSSCFLSSNFYKGRTLWKNHMQLT